MNKTFPFAAKPSPRSVSKNWRKVNGKIVWPNEMKLFLVSRIKEHISVLEGDKNVDPQHKMRVWEQIYKALVRRGMPDSDVRTVKKVWNGLRASTIEVYRRMETKRRNTRTVVDISELQRAIHEVIELSNKLKASGNSVMPMPMKIKIEPMDEGNDILVTPIIADISESVSMNDTQREQQHLQLRSNPVVVLRPLQMDNTATGSNTNGTQHDEIDSQMPAPLVEPKNVSPSPLMPTPMPSMPTPPPSDGENTVAAQQPINNAPEQAISADCRQIYDKIAETELKIKLLQQQKEEQTLEFEREIYARRLAILDTDLKKRNYEIDFLVRSHQPVDNINDPLSLE